LALIESSIQSSTRKKRYAQVQDFVKYLNERGKALFTKDDVLNYLADRFHGNQKFDYESHRTALTTTIHDATGINLAADILFVRSARAVRLIRPRLPKYDDIWDMRTLWRSLQAQGVPDGDNVIDLRAKANVLVRLACAGRQNDVAHIHRPSIVVKPDHLKFRFYKWKTQNRDALKFSNWIFIKKRPDVEEAAICAYTVFLKYLGTLPQAPLCPDVWYAYNNAKPVKSAILASDTRRVLTAAGIPAKYGSHTIRHAAISFWRLNGFTMDEVMKRTGHRSAALVSAFYDKSDISNDLMSRIDAEKDDTEEEWVSEELAPAS
jgi:hypothetical protein